jgi:hypothetical protein
MRKISAVKQVGVFPFDEEEDYVFELVYNTADDIITVNADDEEKQGAELAEAQGNKAELVSYYAEKTVASFSAILARLKLANTTVQLPTRVWKRTLWTRK